MINLKTFLTQAKNKKFWEQSPLFCFQITTTYPATFLTHVLSSLQKESIITIQVKKLNVDAMELNTIMALLSQSMLGMQTFFWLGDFTNECSTSKAKDLLHFLEHYQGPNKVAFALNSVPKKMENHATFVQLDETIDLQMFQDLLFLFETPMTPPKGMLIKKLFAQNNTIPLDVACMLINYLELLNPKNLDDAYYYISSLIGAPPSLATLTEAFFAKNNTTFFTTWSKINSTYPPIFWNVFWAEQIWKAYFVIHFLDAKNFAQAKKISFRLPYSFINKHWEKTSKQELRHAYNFLYSMDFQLKRGSTFCSFDVFFHQFFSGNFKSLQI